MRNALLTVLLLMLCTVVKAQRFLSEVFPGVTKTTNVTYASNYSVLSGGPVLTNLRMDVYEPGGAPDTMARRPLIVFLHSGSFLPPYINTQLEGGRNDSGIVLICESFARRGYVVANIDYRLGWNAVGSNVDIRKGTLINAFVRAIQDVKAAVRYFRKDAATTNTFQIDSNRVIVGGEHTGGALAINYAALKSQSQLTIAKFVSNINDMTYGFVMGQSYVNPAIIGDLDGYGGNASFNNPNNSPGYNGNANFIFSYEGIIGDSSWVTPGLPPIVAFHRVDNNDNQPYLNGIVYVLIPTPQAVVDVSGSGIYMPLTNAKGNNDCFRPNTFSDPYTAKAMALSGGVEGLYPQGDTLAGISWFDSASVMNECQFVYGQSLVACSTIYARNQGINNKPRSLLYLDTLMGYLNPRIVRCLYPSPANVAQQGAGQYEVQIFPNPSFGNVTITASGSGHGIQSIALKDITGKLVQQLACRKEQKIDLRFQDVPPGMYIITVNTDRTSASQKLIIR